jgi:hypothetical protein
MFEALRTAGVKMRGNDLGIVRMCIMFRIYDDF